MPNYLNSLMTIRDAIQSLNAGLRTIYDEGEASSIGDWVIEYLTGTRKSERITRKDILLTPEQQSKLNTILDRLMKHEPVQYVLNEAWFCGLKFFVDPHVLIPRPETEELVEWVVSNCRFPIDRLTILDVGTGSGCIPIALKRRLGKSEVWGCDLSQEALAIAKKNAANLGAAVHFLPLDFLDRHERDSLPSFDIIISNPPYIPSTQMEGMDENVTKYEPHLALFVPDNDPLIFYRHLADFGRSHLHPQGQIYAEIYEDAGPAIVELFEQENFKVELKQDLSGKNRMIRATN